jgi:hypothetical protein
MSLLQKGIFLLYNVLERSFLGFFLFFFQLQAPLRIGLTALKFATGNHTTHQKTTVAASK